MNCINLHNFFVSIKEAASSEKIEEFKKREVKISPKICVAVFYLLRHYCT